MSEKMFEPKQFDSFDRVPEDQKNRFKRAENGGFVYAEALSKEEAEIESEKMQEKIKNGDAADYNEAEKLVNSGKEAMFYEPMLLKAEEIKYCMKKLYVAQSKDSQETEVLCEKISKNIQEIYEYLHGLYVDRMIVDEPAVIKIYQELCCGDNMNGNEIGGYYWQRRYLGKLDQKLLENYDQKIETIEYILGEIIKMPELSLEQQEFIISKSDFILKDENYFTHATESEMLTWIWNNRLQGDDHMAIRNDAKNFGTDRASIYGYFGLASRDFENRKSMLLEDKDLRIAVSKIAMGLKPYQKYMGGYGVNTFRWVQEVASNKNNDEITNISRRIKEKNKDKERLSDLSGAREVWIDFREYAELVSGNFFSREDCDNFNSKEINIFSNMLSRNFEYQGKGGSQDYVSDIALWIKGFYLDQKLSQRGHLVTEYHTGRDVIKAIQCATPYAFEKIMNFFKLQCYDKAEEYIPVFDKDGNMLWPRQMSLEEVKNFVAERDKDKKKEK